MIHRANIIVILLFGFSFSLLNTGITNSAYAEQNDSITNHQTASNKIQGKITDIIDASGYTYAEVDTGKQKVWAAGPVTPLKIGDVIAFSTGMPMENFHSKSMNRDFPIIYFVSFFITDTPNQTSKAASMVSSHSQVKQKLAAKPVEGINKVEGGNTIAEIYTQKQKLNGKKIRVRGQVTKFTAEVMGKNWLHIRDGSTHDDLTVTTDSMAAINDVVIIEGKLELDKDYSYGYVYSVIIEDARITKE
jgi:hypothetical protein